jgi:histidinol-phosphatase (PHP family)
MQTWTNYHCHSFFSDGKCEAEDFVKKAIDLKITSMGFSEHGPVPFETSWNIKHENIERYILEIERLRQKYNHLIEIYCGMEIDHIAAFTNEIIQMIPFKKLDFTIASIHFLGFLSDGNAWNIDGEPEMFERGFHEVYSGSEKALIENYYKETMNMVDSLKPTVIGHIDKIKMHNSGNKYFDENAPYYQNAIHDTLDCIKKKDCIVELNTRGLYKHPGKLSYPSSWILKLMNEKRIRTTLSSDSHKPDELVKEFEFAIDLLKEAGYRSFFQLRNGNWIESPLIQMKQS